MKKILMNLSKYINRETVSYLICGGLATILSIAVFWLCQRAGLHVAVSNTVSTAVVVSFAYFANKIFVFRSNSWKLSTLAREIFTFLSGRLATYIGETLLLVLLVDMLNFPSFYCKIFTTVLVVLANYLISKKAVFGPQL